MKLTVKWLSFLRWAFPLLIFALGTGYVLFELMLLQGQSPGSPIVIRSVLILGLAGPALAWLTLTWAIKATVAEAKAQEELAFRNQELAALNAIGEASESRDLDRILQTALKRVMQVPNIEAADIRLIQAGHLLLAEHCGQSPDFAAAEEKLELGHCMCGGCVQSGQVVVNNDLHTDPQVADLVCFRRGFRSSISVPMMAQGRAVGVIHAASFQRNAFRARKQQTLEEVARRAGSAIVASKLYKQARRRAVYLETASIIAQRTNTLLDPSTLLTEVVKLIREKFGYTHTHILLVDEDAKALVLKEASGPCAEELKRRGFRLRIGEQGITSWVASTGEEILCNDVSQEPRYYPAEPETRAELAVPLHAGDRVIGVLDVQREQPDAFDSEDVTILKILGAQIGSAIENARLFQETRQRYDAMAALHETSLDMIALMDTRELLDGLLRRGVHLLQANAATLFLYDPAKGLIRNIANYNTVRDWTGVVLHPGEGVIGRVVLTGKPLIVNDYQSWPQRSDIFETTRQTKFVGAPLRWQDQVIGGVVIGNLPGTRPFDQNDLWLLSLFADLATIAIKNAELHTQVKQFGQGLERKVEERTHELEKAKEEISAKADQLRSLLAKTISIQEEERGRIARDIHDGVIQLITGARYVLHAAKLNTYSGMSEAVEAKIIIAHEMLEEMEKEIRRAIYNLHPPVLDAVGLIPALRRYATNFQELCGIHCTFQVQGNACRLTGPTEIAIFRIVEEAVQNVATHAKANSVSVVMNFDSTVLSISVEDDGQGFDYRESQGICGNQHLGLIGMQERTRSLGGTLQIGSSPGEGTRLTFQLPLHGES